MEEKGRSATFLNPDRADGLVAILVDGGVVVEGPRADYAVEYQRRAVIVELKGRDVEYAANQVDATASLWLGSLDRADEIAGLIVAARYPKTSSKIQIKQNNFRKRFLGPLHVVCKNCEFEFGALFTFKPLSRS